MSSKRGYALRGTATRADTFHAALKYDSMFVKRLCEILSNKVSPEVLKEAEEQAAKEVLASGAVYTKWEGEQ